MRKLEQVTIAILANSFNLSIFNQIWLVNNNIVTEDEVTSGNAMMSPVAVTLATDQFELLIIPERVQLRITGSSEENSKFELINRVLGGLVDALPHTPYSAVGFNFSYSIAHEDLKNDLSRVKNTYISEANPLAEHFSSEDSRFGLYLSTASILGSRLRLDIKPSNLNNQERQVLNFNYHLDLKSPGQVRVMKEMFHAWSDFKKNSEEILESLAKQIEG